MRIGLDARSLASPRPRGTGRNLLDAYALLPRLHPEWEFVLFHQRPLEPSARTTQPAWQHPNVRARLIDIPGDRLDAWFQLRLPLAARQERIDLMHYPANAAPAWSPVPFVATIHDLAPLNVPGELPPKQTRAFARRARRAVRRAVHIITVSQATRVELHERFAVPLDRMTVVPWAPDAGILRAAQAGLAPAAREQLRQRYRLADRWLVTFSGSSPRKNARGVLAGFARAALNKRADVQVVLVGCEPASCRAALRAEAERLGIADHCGILGFVPCNDLPALMLGACGLLMPSRCEGFGLPILDAFACSAPVLTSNLSSMPEVAGDAALYCDPNDPASIAAGIERLLDPATAADLVARGRAQLARFSWERTAGALGDVYAGCLRRLTSRSKPAVLEGCPQ